MASKRELARHRNWLVICFWARDRRCGDMRLRNPMRTQTAGLAFTLVEALVAMAIVGVVFVSLYAGIAHGFYTIQIARENLRATQIMIEKTEVIRVLTWSQINSNGFIPVHFTAPYDPNPKNPKTGPGAIYSGTITITPVGLNTDYDSDLRLVRIKIHWKTRDLVRSREMTTYFSKYGVQNYLLRH